MNAPIRTLLTLALLGAFAVTLTACNTMSGLGKDTAALGNKVEEKAEEHLDDDDDDTPDRLQLP